MEQVEKEIPWGKDHIDPKNVLVLNYLLQRNPDVKIVISSTWRLPIKTEFLKVKGWLEDIINAPIIGCTPHLDVDRGLEIYEWLKDPLHESVDSILILDDNSDMDPLYPFLTQTDLFEGLTFSHLNDMKRILASPFVLPNIK